VDRGRRICDEVLLPTVRNIQSPADRVVFFENVERRFSRQARFTTTLAGLTGFYMIVRLDLWDRFLSIAYWWMHAMVGTARFTSAKRPISASDKAGHFQTTPLWPR
jgi:hypothetical protein